MRPILNRGHPNNQLLTYLGQSRVRLTVSLGVACVEQIGYDLDRLRAAAAAAAARATAEGGNRVIAADAVTT